MVCSHLVFDNTSYKIVKPLTEEKKYIYIYINAGFKEIIF